MAEKTDVLKLENSIVTLYDYVIGGTLRASTDEGKSAFKTMRYRMELLFPFLKELPEYKNLEEK